MASMLFQNWNILVCMDNVGVPFRSKNYITTKMSSVPTGTQKTADTMVGMIDHEDV
jgi:predicted RNA-binding protein with PIN domain